MTAGALLVGASMVVTAVLPFGDRRARDCTTCTRASADPTREVPQETDEKAPEPRATTPPVVDFTLRESGGESPPRYPV